MRVGRDWLGIKLLVISFVEISRSATAALDIVNAIWLSCNEL
jgi:hypothetical protein